MDTNSNYERMRQVISILTINEVLEPTVTIIATKSITAGFNSKLITAFANA